MLLQVFAAALIKCRLKAPKNPSELYEVDADMSAVHGSRKLGHSNQLRCAHTALPLLLHVLLMSSQTRSLWQVRLYRRNHQCDTLGAHMCV